MSHRLALTLSLLLTIAFALLVVVERDRLFGASVASPSAGALSDPPAADPARSDALPGPGGAGGNAILSGADLIDGSLPGGGGPNQADAASVLDGATSQPPRAPRPRDRDGQRGDAHADEHAGEHGDD
jgi:hypothetical protein